MALRMTTHFPIALFRPRRLLSLKGREKGTRGLAGNIVGEHSHAVRNTRFSPSESAFYFLTS